MMQKLADTRNIEGYELSHQQQQYWTQAGNPGLVTQAVLRLNTADPAPLLRRLKLLITRHEVLRTYFPSLAGMQFPVQCVMPDPLIDFREMEDESFEQAAKADCARPFSFATGPLLRVSLITASSGKRWLILSIPALCLDRPGMERLLRQLPQAGNEEEEAVQYVQFCEWQRLNELSNSPLDPSSGSLYFTSNSSGVWQTASAFASIDTQITAKIMEFSDSLSCRANDILFTAYHVLLQRHSEEGVSAAIGWRPSEYPELADALGAFQSHSRISLDFQDTTTFRSLVTQAALRRQETLEAPPRVSSTPHLFQFDCAEAVSFDDALFDVVQISGFSEEFQLHLEVTISADEFSIALSWDSRAITDAQGRQLLSRYIRCLTAALVEPDIPVGSLSVLVDADIQRINAWGQGEQRPVEQVLSVAELILQQASENPDSLAVATANMQWTYSELELRSRQIAALLLSNRPVDASPLIAIQMRRSPHAIAAVLGVLRAGCAYLPLQVSAPIDRISLILRDSGVDFVLAESAAGLPSGVKVLDTSDTAEVWRMEADTIMPPPVVAENLAYVIYTSGSTGTPKGVMISNRTLLASTQARSHYYKDRVGAFLLLSPLVFDSSVAGLFWTLSQGGALVLPDENFQNDTARLLDLIEDRQITHLLCLPSLYRALLHSGGNLTSLSTIIVAGEECSGAVVADHRQIIPQAELHNEYGPTECTVWATKYLCGSVSTRIPIGNPIVNTTTYILNDYGTLAVPGMLGELYIGGSGVSNGYLNDAALTAERFVPDPWSRQSGARLYRTGDLVRYNSDGNLEFLGRRDQQVKIRGHRIDLGEIEARLLDHSSVFESVVCLAGEESSQCLVAFVLGSKMDIPALQAYLVAQLPGYMVPSRIHSLPSFPRTATGKIDRKELLARLSERNAAEWIAPCTEMEKIVAAAYSAALGVERVGAFDGFFELGGDSIKGIVMINRLQTRLGSRVDFGSLFEAGTVRELAQRLESAGIIADQPPPIVKNMQIQSIMQLPRTGEKTLFPMSFGQERLWLIHRLSPESPSYHLPARFQLKGLLDYDILQRAIHTLIERHESLRTTFLDVDGIPMQRIHRLLPPELCFTDAVEEDDNSGFLRAPFNLSKGPLIRFLVSRESEQSHTLSIVLHHIIADGWSVQQIVKELVAIYEADSLGALPRLNANPVQYADWASWQRQRWNDAEIESRLAYWKQHLTNTSASLFENVTEERDCHQDDRIYRETWNQNIPGGINIRPSRGLFPSLITAFQVAIWGLLGRADVVIGFPYAGRDHSEAENIVGFLVNTLPLQCNLQTELTLDQQIQQTALSIRKAIEHEVPLESIVKAWNPDRDRQDGSLFHVLVSLQQKLPSEIRTSRLVIREQPLDETLAKVDLQLDFFEAEKGLDCEVRCRGGRVPVDFAQRVTAIMKAVISEATVSPSTLIRDLDVLDTDATLLRSQAQLRPTSAQTVCDRFNEMVLRFPDSTALREGTSVRTYASLDEESSALAQKLQAQGVNPGSFVAIPAKRSLHTVVRMLAILKAGCAYVPIELADPLNRIQAFIGKVQIRYWFGDETNLPEGCSLRQIAGNGVVSESNGTYYHPAVPESIAYVMQTSGSTGEPKAVAIPHRSIVNLTVDANYFSAGNQDRVLQNAPLGFDASTFEIWGALLNGAELVIAPSGYPLSSSGLAQIIIDQEITILWLTSGLFRVMSRQQPEALYTVRQILAGGEVLPFSDVQEHLSHIDVASILVNGYGPTETTTFCVCHRMNSPLLTGTSVPIGKPISGYATYVATSSLDLMPNERQGELFIGGAGLAHGYWNDPAATAERFLPDPWSNIPGSRVYSTGDLACWNAIGDLEFLGRSDQQIKIRGHRIEPAEVENVLVAHPSVEQAVALPVYQEGRAEHLKAYVVLTKGQAIDKQALKQHCSRSLPEWLIPFSITVIPTLPLTPNGKVDRRALSTHTPENRNAGAEFLSEAESRMATVWSNILTLPSVDPCENFFALGGHSLKALELIAAVREVFEIEPPLVLLFENPTVRTFTQAVLIHEQDTLSLTVLPDLDGQNEAFPLTDVQQAYLIGRREDMPLGSVAAHSYLELDSTEIEPDRLEIALNQLIERHSALRTVVRTDGMQQVLTGLPPFRIRVLDLRGLPSEVQESRLVEIRNEMSHAVMDTAQWPLFDIRVTRLDSNCIRIHIGLDVLIADAHSFRILAHDLSKFYLEEGCNLTPLPISFRDYVLATKQLQATPNYEKCVRYWRNRLAELPGPPELPLVSQADLVDEPTFQRLHGSLSQECWDALKQRAGDAGVTPSTLLLATFAEVVSHWSTQGRFTINLTLFNRLAIHDSISEVVGDFTSLTLLEIDTTTPGSLKELASNIQRQLWTDLDHRLFSGIEVMRELAATRGSAGIPVSMPVVFTSTLDLTAESEPDFYHMGSVAYSITQTPQVRLDHQVFEENGTLAFNWDFRNGCFPEGMVTSMFEVYQDLLLDLAVNFASFSAPRHSLTPQSDLSLVRQINGLQQVNVKEDSTITLETLFTRQADKQPDALAIGSILRDMTYGELLAESAALAHQLLEAGVQLGEPVAIVMYKGWEQVVATLGILRAGAAYVPIDSTLPPARIRHLLQTARTRFVVIQASDQDTEEWSEDRVLLAVVPGHSKIFAPLPSFDENRLAYVIFTSGSTGEPKGVMIDHRGAVNTILDVNDRFQVAPADRVLGISSLSFDLSVYDIFGLLAAGGAIIIPEPSRLLDVKHWKELVQSYSVSIWNSVPALLQLLIDDSSSSTLQTLRLAMMSGDWIPLDLPKSITLLAPKIQQVSLGGATEASIWSILYPIQRVDPSWKSIPYGVAMCNQSIFVLDNQLDPRPVWATGPIYIGGSGLALGYWDDDAKTKASFQIHPHSGERLYRTGDLGRLHPDGYIELLGREDLQVKVNGFRVELAEIESVISRCPSIAQCAVVAVGSAGARQLGAFYTGDSTATSIIETELERSLPRYMHPRLFPVLKIPLTANGKVDRTKLVAWMESSVRERLNESEPQKRPLTEFEEKIASVWELELHVRPVSPKVGFFELGGNSLAALRVLSRLRRELSIDAPLRLIYEHPSLEAFAASLEVIQIPSLAPSVHSAPVPDTVYLASDLQQEMWLGHLRSQNQGEYNITEALQLEDGVDPLRLRQALQRVSLRHQLLRSSFQERDGQLQIRVHSNVDIPFEVCLTKVNQPLASQIAEIAKADAQRPFTISEAPLFRCIALSSPESQYIRGLIVTFHHLIADAASVWLFLEDVRIAYEWNDEVSGDRPLPSQFRDILVRRKNVTDIQKSREFWRTYLKDAASPRFSSTAVTEPGGGTLGCTVPPALAMNILAGAAAANLSPFALFLTAWAMVLSEHIEGRKVLLSINVDAREDGESASAIGPLLYQLPLCIDIQTEISCGEVLTSCHESVITARGHATASSLLLERWSGLQRADLFNFKLDYQEGNAGILRIGDAQVRPLPIPVTVTHSQLVLQVTAFTDSFHLNALYSRSAVTQEIVSTLLDRMLVALEVLSEDRSHPLHTAKARWQEKELHERNIAKKAMEDSRHTSFQYRFARHKQQENKH